MNGKTEPYSDPLIDEVRQRRADLFASLGSNLAKLFEAIQRLQRQHPEKVSRPSTRSQAHTGPAVHSPARNDKSF